MIDFYFLCVDFMTELANITNSTYRDTNMIILFGFLPGVIIFDVLLFLYLYLNVMINPKET
jgi:hypothetical protein